MTPGNEQRPGWGPQALRNEFDGSPVILPKFPEEVVDELTRFSVRLIQDAIATAAPWFWLRRAQTFEDARPRSGDYIGQATAADLAERDARLAGSAEVCRLHARFLTENPTPLAAYERNLVAGMLEGAAA